MSLTFTFWYNKKTLEEQYNISLLFIKAFFYLWNVDVTNKNLEFPPFYLIENTKINFPLFSVVVHRLSGPRVETVWHSIMKRNGWFWLVWSLAIYLYFPTTDRYGYGALQISHWTFHSFFLLSEPNQICTEISAKNSY